MDPTYSITTAADPFIKVEPDTESYERESSVFSTIVVGHPGVKVEPESDPYDYEVEDSMFTTVPAQIAASVESQPSRSGHEAERNMGSAIAVADPIIKAEPQQEHSDNEADAEMQDTPTVTDLLVKDEPEVDIYGAANNMRSVPQSDITIKLTLPQTVRVLNIGLTKDKKMFRMKEQGRSILTLCRNVRNGIAANRADEMIKRFEDAALFVDWLDTSLEITPDIKLATRVDYVLQTLSTTSNIPAELADKARGLYERYEAENWGQDTVIDEEPDTPPAASPVMAASSNAGGDTIGEIVVPAANDPIFGQGGIMYGIIIDTSGKGKTYRLRADIPRRNTKVYGHNGIEVGTWYPYQINALFWGAHGARMGGIAGSVTTGAWSIVVSSAYEDLDSDHGDILYYSGSNSHTNENPEESAPASTGTKALHASIATRNPVRVLRSGSGPRNRNHNQYLPSCGMRYDGLYRVTLFRHRINQKNGRYDQFKLERLPDQTPLAHLQRTSPTTDQIMALGRLRGKP